MNLFNYLMSKKGHNTSVRDDLLAYLLGKRTPKEVKTATGTTISITDVTSTKIVSLTLSKESSQETTTGKNLLNVDLTFPQEAGGITLTKDADGKININGTATSVASIFITSQTNITLEPGTYTLSRPEHFSCFLIPGYKAGTFTLTEETTFTQAYIPVQNHHIGNTYDESFYPMLVSGDTLGDYEPYTGGQPSPNPDYPQEVKTVKGYRNLFDKDNVTWQRNNNGKFNIGNTNNNTTRIRTSSFEIAGGNTYTINGIPDGISLMMIRTYNEYEGEKIADIRPSDNVFVLDQSVKYIHLLFSGSNFTDETNILMKNANIQITEGAEELPYVPYGNNYVNVKVTGKNLYDSSYRNQNGTINGSSNTTITESNGVYSATRTDGSPLYIWSQTSSGSSYASGNGTLVEVETGVTYAITITNSLFNNNFLVTYNEDKVSTGFVSRGNSFTFTPTGNIKYISMRIGMTNSEANVTYSTSVQVEKGSATEYEPYKESIVTLPLNGNEIAGIGDYKDELIVDKNGHCWLNKKTAKIDSYNGETITTNYMSTTGGLDTGATVYYVLDTPQLIDLNYTVDIRLFNGVNNISNSDDMDMTLKYY